MSVCLNRHDHSVLSFMLWLFIFIVAIASVCVSFWVRSEVIVIENAFLGGHNLVVALVAEEVIASLVERVNWVFRVRHGAGEEALWPRVDAMVGVEAKVKSS